MSNTESPEFFQGDISILLIFAIMMLIMSAILSLIIGLVWVIPGFLGSFLIRKLTGVSEEEKIWKNSHRFSRSDIHRDFDDAREKFED